MLLNWMKGASSFTCRGLSWILCWLLLNQGFPNKVLLPMKYFVLFIHKFHWSILLKKHVHFCSIIFGPPFKAHIFIFVFKKWVFWEWFQPSSHMVTRNDKVLHRSSKIWKSAFFPSPIIIIAFEINLRGTLPNFRTPYRNHSCGLQKKVVFDWKFCFSMPLVSN